MITMDVNSRAVTASILSLERRLDGAVRQSLIATALEALRLTQFEVPHDEGTLQNSGTVDEVGQDVTLGYHTRYAARLHEHPEYRFQKGRKGKYIEDPIMRNRGPLNLKFGRTMQTRLF